MATAHLLGQPSGVQKPTGNAYSTGVRRLQEVMKDKLLLLSEMELARSNLQKKEQVLKELIAQQDCRMQHLQLVRAGCRGLSALPMDSPALSNDPVLEAILAPGSTQSQNLNGCDASCGATPAGRAAGAAGLRATLPTTLQPCLSQHKAGCSRHLLVPRSGHEQASSDLSATTCALSGPCLVPGGSSACGCIGAVSTSMLTCCTPGGSTACCYSSVQYCHQLMMSATAEQWKRAMDMTVEEWSEYYTGVVMRVCLNLEVLNRKDPAQSAGALLSGRLATPSRDDTSSSVQRSLEAEVDDFVTIINLSLMYNPIPVRKAVFINHLSQDQVAVVPATHWRQAHSRVHLTEDQRTLLKLKYEQYSRTLGKVQSQQEGLVQDIARSTGDKQQGEPLTVPTSSISAAGKGTSISSGVNSRMWGAVEAAMAATHARDRLEQQLSGHMSTWATAGVLLYQVFCNTLTKMQLAQVLVGCYPFLPRLTFVIGHLLDVKEKAATEVQPDLLCRQAIAALAAAHTPASTADASSGPAL